MQKCPELRKLPKAPRFKSVNSRRQCPGSPTTLLSPFTSKFFLDPTHPATNIPRNRFPHFRTDALGITAYPMAILDKPRITIEKELRWPLDTWNARVLRSKLADTTLDTFTLAPMLSNNTKPSTVSMSLNMVTRKKKTSKLRHIRLAINRKVKNAISLVVVRGADAQNVNGRSSLVLNTEEAKEQGDKWILQGWTYIVHPTLELYQMPYHTLIPIIRTALRFIWEMGTRMEQNWIIDLREHNIVAKDITSKQKPKTREQSSGEGRAKLPRVVDPCSAETNLHAPAVRKRHDTRPSRSLRVSTQPLISEVKIVDARPLIATLPESGTTNTPQKRVQAVTELNALMEKHHAAKGPHRLPVSTQPDIPGVKNVNASPLIAARPESGSTNTPENRVRPAIELDTLMEKHHAAKALQGVFRPPPVAKAQHEVRSGWAANLPPSEGENEGYKRFDDRSLSEQREAGLDSKSGVNSSSEGHPSL